MDARRIDQTLERAAMSADNRRGDRSWCANPLQR
jgi:hypothetical protein